MATPLLFRQEDGERWRAASTVNISRTGVLFRSDGPAPDQGRDLQFTLGLPVLGTAQVTEIRCTGRVVRVRPDDQTVGGWVAAATIAAYEFVSQSP